MLGIYQSLLLRSLGWSLADSVWQMGVLWLLYYLFTGVGESFTAKVRHLIALLLTSCGTAWFVVSVVIRLVNPTQHSAAADAYAPAEKLSNLASFFHSVRQFGNEIMPYLSTIYLAAVAFLLIRYLRGLFRLRHIRQTGGRKLQGELRIFCSSLALRMGIKKKISVWVSGAIDSPVTIGFLKPLILVPIATVTHLSTEQLESILLHELAHIQRNDYLINLLLSLNSHIFFFNPFARLLMASIRKERENCCDDLVIQFRYNPHSYASALLSLERTRHFPAGFAVTAAGQSHKLLLERVQRVTGQPLLKKNHLSSLSVSLLAAALVCLVSFIGTKNESKTGAERQGINTLGHPFLIQNAIFPARQEGFAVPIRSVPPRVKEKEMHKKRQRWQVAKNDLINPKEKPETQTWTIVTAGTESSDEPQIYSIETTTKSAVSPDQPLPPGAPYVPKASFHFEAAPEKAPDAQKQDPCKIRAKAKSEKAFLAANQRNQEELQIMLSDSRDESQSRALRLAIDESARALNWQRLRQAKDMGQVLSSDALNKVQIQLMANMGTLHKLELNRNTSKTFLIKPIININQNKKNQEVFKKEFESIQKTQQSMRKRYRVVYI